MRKGYCGACGSSPRPCAGAVRNPDIPIGAVAPQALRCPAAGAAASGSRPARSARTSRVVESGPRNEWRRDNVLMRAFCARCSVARRPSPGPPRRWRGVQRRMPGRLQDRKPSSVRVADHPFRTGDPAPTTSTVLGILRQTDVTARELCPGARMLQPGDKNPTAKANAVATLRDRASSLSFLDTMLW